MPPNVSQLFVTGPSCFAGLSSFPKSLSKAAASSSKATPAEIADVEHATRRAQPEACFDAAVTKAVSLLAASTCTPSDVLSQCIPSTCVQGEAASRALKHIACLNCFQFLFFSF
jgi:hypothetical protein